MKSKRRWLVPVILGFIVLYTVIMLACTYLVEKKFEMEFASDVGNIGYGVRDEILQLKEEGAAGERLMFTYVDTAYRLFMLNDYQQIAWNFYDVDLEETIKTDTAFWDYWTAAGGQEENWRHKGILLEDYFSEEETEQIARFLEKNYQNRKKAAGMPDEYRFIGDVSKDGKELYSLMIQKIFWDTEKGAKARQDSLMGGTRSGSYEDSQGNLTTYVQAGDEVVWEWHSERAQDGGERRELTPVGPKVSKVRNRWKNSTFLQNSLAENAKEQFENWNWNNGSTKYRIMNTGNYHENPFEDCYSLDMAVIPNEESSPVCYITMAVQSQPWRAAADYMRWVYLAGLILMAACMGKVIFVMEKSERQKERMEAVRRDFTNAMAHKMKTPLGIIRGFSENLKENTVEEKRDYYLEQIIAQTEEMDALVMELLSVAKIDAERLVLQKEKVSVNGLANRLVEKLKPMFEEKNLQVYIDEEDEFVLEGDEVYLEKAFWNLLDNAARYSTADSQVHMTIQEKGFCLVNPYTGEPQGQGLGLYLTERILKLHDLKLTHVYKDGECTVRVERRRG